MMMPSLRAEPIDDREALKLAVIEQTYPRWDIQHRRNGMWTATRVTPPTPTQAAAGLHSCVLQPNLDALSAVLCQQLLIAQTTG